MSGLEVSKTSIVYALAPAGVVSGGVELLHQLVSILRDNSVDARIVYYGSCPHTCPSDYDVYNLSFAQDIVDDRNNVLVVPESVFDKSLKFNNIQTVLWWLSVDNFFALEAELLSFSDLFGFDRKRAVSLLIKRCTHPEQLFDFYRNKVSIKKLKQKNAVSAYQSEYARIFLEKRGFKRIVPLKDYINTDHYSSDCMSAKEDLVLYNPKKGYIYTQKLINAAPDINWVPIINMCREEVISLMRKAKVYIDFGNHPGKDRLPRECAVNGCCIITGKRGAAGNDLDVCIPKEYKFDETDNVLPVISCIRSTLDNYSQVVDLFSDYRDRILREQEEFVEQALKLFSINK